MAYSLSVALYANESKRERKSRREKEEATPSSLFFLPTSTSFLPSFHFPSLAAACCSLSHLGEYVTGTASSFAARLTSASVTPPAACVVASTRTRVHSVRWKSGWWPAASATSAAAERKATAAAKFFVRKSREREVPSGERRQAGREGSLASRSARERSGVSLL